MVARIVLQAPRVDKARTVSLILQPLGPLLWRPNHVRDGNWIGARHAGDDAHVLGGAMTAADA